MLRAKYNLQSERTFETPCRLRRLIGLWGKKIQRDLGEGILGMLVQCTKDSCAVLTYSRGSVRPVMREKKTKQKVSFSTKF